MELSHNSDARLTVVKRGPRCWEQGYYLQWLQQLGVRGSPRVERSLDNGYEMEMLQQPQDSVLVPSWRKLYITSRQLRATYWTIPLVKLDDEKYDWTRRTWDWRTPLAEWLLPHAPSVCGDMWHLYPEVTRPEQHVVIHGDPTLANRMRRPGSEPHEDDVLIDPLPPRWPGWREWCPGLPEVDLGKLLQSALGWEQRLLAGGWPELTGSLERGQMILSEFDDQTRARSWWWCKVHLTRIILRSKRQKQDVLAADTTELLRALCDAVRAH